MPDNIMTDVFTPDAFSVNTLTAHVSTRPFKPGYVSSLGLFQTEGVTTLSVSIEEQNGVLRLVQTRERGAPKRGQQRERRKIRSFNIPHLPQDDVVRATEVQGVRAFGSTSALQTVEALRNQRLNQMSDNIDVTIESHRLGAVKGVILDADGEVIYDLFEEFKVAKPAVVDMDLDNANPAEGALRKKCGGLVREIKKELGADEPGGIVALCGDNFYDDLVGHKEARETYKYQEGRQLREGYVYESFRFGGVTWVNYQQGGFNLIDTDEAHVFPAGVPGLFITRFGPADYIETVNTLGLPRYAKAVVDPWGKFVELEVQSNPLNLCTRPRVLRTLKRT